MHSKISFCFFRTCIISFVKDSQYFTDQIYGLLLAEMHRCISRIQGVQAILLVFFYICFVTNNERADFAVLQISAAAKPLDEDVLPAAEVRLHAVSVYREDAVSTFCIGGGVDVDGLTFVIEFSRITDTGGKLPFIIG